MLTPLWRRAIILGCDVRQQSREGLRARLPLVVARAIATRPARLMLSVAGTGAASSRTERRGRPTPWGADIGRALLPGEVLMSGIAQVLKVWLYIAPLELLVAMLRLLLLPILAILALVLR